MKWLEPESVQVPEEVLASAGGDALLSQALVRRGVCTAQAARAFLDPQCYTPASPFELPDMAVAVERLRAAIARGERILVWGDFDVDGLTSTALLTEALVALGAQVDWYVPTRSESHGVHWRSLQPFLGRGARVLLTCDTGVTAHEALTLARNAGLDVIVTDHHELPATLPPALAILNPHRLPDVHPLHALSGVGVAYQVAAALGMPESGLDLAAMGLVADLVPLQGDVRHLVQRGLPAMRCSERPGLRALLEVAGVDQALLDEQDISFSLAPRLNALGRLSHASAGVELLLTADLARARAIAAEAEALNVRRQFLSRQIAAAAREQVQRDPALADSPIWVLSHPTWPGGVLGVAAGRLAERYYRPVVLIANPPGEPARGSARSVPGVDIYAALSAQAGLLSTFGGHAMAAGFSIPAERIPDLRRGLVQGVVAQVGAELRERELRIEAYFAWPGLTLELYDGLRRLAPFGPGNSPLTLASRHLRVASETTMGRTGEHRKLQVMDESGRAQTVLWWRGADEALPEGWFDLAYRLDDNLFRDQRKLQVVWTDARWEVTPTVELAAPVISADVADYRSEAQPTSALQALWDAEAMQLWAEGAAVPGLPARGRHELQPSVALVAWTAPPGPDEWAAALRCVRPQQVYLFAVDAGLDTADAFLRRLAGLVKHALSAYGGRLEWQALAAATGQRIATVQAGLRWLAALGVCTVIEEQSDGVAVASGGLRDPELVKSAQPIVEALLRETAAYRRYFHEVDARKLLL